MKPLARLPLKAKLAMSVLALMATLEILRRQSLMDAKSEREKEEVTRNLPVRETSTVQYSNQMPGTVILIHSSMFDVILRFNHPDLLYFNRVPKTGSENFVFLLQKLSARNGFVHRRYGHPEPRRIDESKQAFNVKTVMVGKT